MRTDKAPTRISFALGGALFLIVLTANVRAAVLHPSSPIIMADTEPASVRRALQDLQRDLKKVLGAEPPILNSVSSNSGTGAILVIGPASPKGKWGDPAIKGWESHGIFVRHSSSMPLVVLQGADTRGTIYAIYEFSERFLGIPAAWYWASWIPEAKKQITVPDRTRLIFPGPYVKWRAWFPADQDLVRAWHIGSQDRFEAWAETMLRMKLNMYEGGLLDAASFSPPYPLGRMTQVAKERGIAVVGHHMLVFGSQYDHWDLYWNQIRHQEPPKLLLSNLDALKDFWKYHIERASQAKLEVVWVLALRANRDMPFWTFFPDAPKTPEERGATIHRFLVEQAELLKKVTGDPAPLMRNTFYSEIEELFAQGLFRPPDYPSLIWTFVCARRDHFPADDIRNYDPPPDRLLGYYMNLGFSLSGAHLAAAEGPWKMEWSYRFVNSRGKRPLHFSVVNVGNYREFIMEAAANAKMLWNFESYNTDRFLPEFCATYFGQANAARIAALWRSFYDAYWTQKKPDLPGLQRQYVFQDLRYARALEDFMVLIPKGPNLNPLTDHTVRFWPGYEIDKLAPGRLYRIVPEDNQANNQLDAIIKGTEASAANFVQVVAECDRILPKLPERSRPFFNDILRIQARYMLELNRTLNAAARAQRVLPDRLEARQHLLDARQHFAALKEVLKEAEHGSFTGWYEGDRLFGMKALDENMAAVIEGLGR